MSSSAPTRQRNGRHRLTAHFDRDTHDLEVLIRSANEELFTDLTVHESKVPYFRAVVRHKPTGEFPQAKIWKLDGPYFRG
jgi:hypothetical protein